jgi:hypothetical protein
LRRHVCTSGRAARTDALSYDPRTNSLYLLSDQEQATIWANRRRRKGLAVEESLFAFGLLACEVTGDILKVDFAVRVNPTHFAGPHRLFLEMLDTEKHASPAPYSGSWTVPAEQSEAALSAWPADRSCQAATPVPPLGVYISITRTSAELGLIRNRVERGRSVKQGLRSSAPLPSSTRSAEVSRGESPAR